MVHFNIRLRDNVYAHWRHEYLDYKRLKRVLRRQQAVDGQLAEALLEASNASSSQTTTSVSSPAELQSLLLAPVDFEELLAQQFAKVEAAYARHLATLRAQFALVRDQSVHAATPAARESIRNTLVELHRQGNHLVNFALLNYTGFIKILKKHDKRREPTQPPLSRSQHPQRFAFSDPRGCRALLLEIEELFARLFCDGNRAVAAASLLTKREDHVNWGHIYIGIKIGSCLLLLIWVGWDSLVVPTFRSERERHVIDLAVTRAYPVYRGIGCCLLLHWLLGVSLYVWRSARINYRYIFELNPRTTPHFTQIFGDATNMTIVYLVNVLLYYKVVNGFFPEQVLHRGYYPLGLFTYAIYYYGIRRWRQQAGLLRTMLQVMGSPFFAVSFLHVFVGDYLTSTVKVTQDLAWSVCFFATKEFLQKDQVQPDTLVLSPQGEGPPPLFKGVTSTSACQQNPYYVKVIVPLICALPLWWRFLQCLRRIYDTESWWPHLPNAFKYALAQVVALFGLFHPFYRVGASADDVLVELAINSANDVAGLRAFQVAWIVLFTLSSLYTWTWDVWMDWGLGRPEFGFLADRRMFSRIWVYYVAMVADLFLRFAWMLSLIPPHSSSTLPLYFQPFTMVLELFRRTFWSFFRLENEHLRNTQGFRRVDFIPLHYDHGVGEDKHARHPDDDDDDAPLAGHMFVLKILLILFAVLGLSILAIMVEK